MFSVDCDERTLLSPSTVYGYASVVAQFSRAQTHTNLPSTLYQEQQLLFFLFICCRCSRGYMDVLLAFCGQLSIALCPSTNLFLLSALPLHTYSSPAHSLTHSPTDNTNTHRHIRFTLISAWLLALYYHHSRSKDRVWSEIWK